MYIIMAAAVCMTACHKKKTPEQSSEADTIIEIVDEEDDYGYADVTDTTADDVAAWLKTVSMDSVERLLCRHGGNVAIPDGRTLHVNITDVLRCIPDKAMDYPFKEAAKSLDISDLRSADGRVRIITWNTGKGGTCPDIARFTLLKGDDGRVHSQGHNHGEALVLKIHQLSPLGHHQQDNKGGTIYLTYDYFREGNTVGAAWMDAWYIQGDSLCEANVFPNGESKVGLEYKIPDWYAITNNGEGYDWLFELVGRNLYVPESTLDQILTDHYKLYRWMGDHFDLLGVVGNRRLHISLKEYESLQYYFVTKDYRVRVDRLDNGSYRYASWRRSKQTDTKPDLVITGGKCDEEKGCYLFENDGYYYRVTTTEGENHLIVEKDGRAVLRQNIE